MVGQIVHVPSLHLLRILGQGASACPVPSAGLEAPRRRRWLAARSLGGTRAACEAGRLDPKESLSAVLNLASMSCPGRCLTPASQLMPDMIPSWFVDRVLFAGITRSGSHSSSLVKDWDSGGE